ETLLFCQSILYLCSPIYNAIIMLDLKAKTIDEARQGEAFQAAQGGTTGQYNWRFYIVSYGCQMNVNDSEIVAYILSKEGFGPTTYMEEADVILLNTCSIREKAEQTVRNRLRIFRSFKKERPNLLIGVLGCMAERLKSKLLEEE